MGFRCRGKILKIVAKNLGCDKLASGVVWYWATTTTGHLGAIWSFPP